MRSWLISLPYDLKILYEASSDENLPRPIRESVVGAIIYVVSPQDSITSDRDDFASYVDDCIVLRQAISQLHTAKDEDSEFFVSRFTEFFEPLTDEMNVCKSALGDLYGWLEQKIPALTSLEYKGKKVPMFLDDEEARELLYEDGLGFATEYPIDEEKLADRFKKSSRVIEVLERRKAEEPK